MTKCLNCGKETELICLHFCNDECKRDFWAGNYKTPEQKELEEDVRLNHLPFRKNYGL